MQDPYRKADIVIKTIFPEFIEDYFQEIKSTKNNLPRTSIQRIMNKQSINLPQLLKNYYTSMTSHNDVPARTEFALKVYESLREKFTRINEKVMFSIYETFYCDLEQLTLSLIIRVK